MGGHSHVLPDLHVQTQTQYQDGITRILQPSGVAFVPNKQTIMVILHFVTISLLTAGVKPPVRKYRVTASTAKLESYKRIIPINVPLSVQLTCVGFALNN